MVLLILGRLADHLPFMHFKTNTPVIELVGVTQVQANSTSFSAPMVDGELIV